MITKTRNPRSEASSLLPDGYEARVLEPSPPANTDPDWYADDPTDPGMSDGTVVTPIEGDGVTWDEIAIEHPDVASYAADHWLGKLKRLQPVPERYESTRKALHEAAFFALAPRRHQANGKLGLRYTYGGFGTPFFGEDEQVRVEGDLLVYQSGDQVATTSLTTPADACEFLGIPFRAVWFDDFHDPLPPIDPNTSWNVDPDAAAAVADWFGFATLVLEQTRRTPGAEDVTRAQLWPEHFDPAMEMGSYEKGHRASFGASPGDGGHPEPYLYVAAWGEVDRDDPFWNDETFNGASLSYRQLLEAEDQKQTAVDFYRDGYRRLTSADQGR